MSVELLYRCLLRIGARRVGHVRNLAVQADQEADAFGQVAVSHLHSVGVGDLAIGIPVEVERLSSWPLRCAT